MEETNWKHVVTTFGQLLKLLYRQTQMTEYATDLGMGGGAVANSTPIQMNFRQEPMAPRKPSSRQLFDTLVSRVQELPPLQINYRPEPMAPQNHPPRNQFPQEPVLPPPVEDPNVTTNTSYRFPATIIRNNPPLKLVNNKFTDMVFHVIRTNNWLLDELIKIGGPLVPLEILLADYVRWATGKYRLLFRLLNAPPTDYDLQIIMKCGPNIKQAATMIMSNNLMLRELLANIDRLVEASRRIVPTGLLPSADPVDNPNRQNAAAPGNPQDQHESVGRPLNLESFLERRDRADLLEAEAAARGESPDPSVSDASSFVPSYTIPRNQPPPGAPVAAYPQQNPEPVVRPTGNVQTNRRPFETVRNGRGHLYPTKFFAKNQHLPVAIDPSYESQASNVDIFMELMSTIDIFVMHWAGGLTEDEKQALINHVNRVINIFLVRFDAQEKARMQRLRDQQQAVLAEINLAL